MRIKWLQMSPARTAEHLWRYEGHGFSRANHHMKRRQESAMFYEGHRFSRAAAPTHEAGL